MCFRIPLGRSLVASKMLQTCSMPFMGPSRFLMQNQSRIRRSLLRDLSRKSNNCISAELKLTYKGSDNNCDSFRMSDILDTSSLVEHGKNAKQILCIRCKSKILPPQMGTYEVLSFFCYDLFLTIIFQFEGI